ncbi:type II toxin-antitoxin system RelE/ParE family toxin [Anabaena cylindrica UHCC 0172]|uniref:type II toxin-antitoxin system RelE/ParE family toxin n=1 Tax=Anabaena cylindrica TaxID=1165 RepID=UPI002B207844|nr:type II toxin-antitoxin system RelE/ParE family toxin [Anabaena cylindrica]MEA5552239.1 type II toxin-antitoxin system RelE/ParE family toxin [Anabaena cylindrica UHCC 0172]
MAYQVVWSSAAIEDVEAIATYISHDSSAYAAAVVHKIVDVTHNLGNFPFSGRVVPELNEDNIREKFAYKPHLY